MTSAIPLPPRITSEENSQTFEKAWTEYGARVAQYKQATSQISPDTVMQFFGDLLSGEGNEEEEQQTEEDLLTEKSALDDPSETPVGW